MALEESKSYQLRVRVTAEERDLLERLRAERNRGETISDLVREALSMLTRPKLDGTSSALSPGLRAQVEHLAQLLKREPHQVEQACVEGILDLIERRCEVPLIVMETYLHLKYKGHGHGGDEKDEPPPNHGEGQPAESGTKQTAIEKAAMKVA